MFIKLVLHTEMYHMTCINDKKALMVIFGKFNMVAHCHFLRKNVFNSNYNMNISIYF